MMSPMEMPKNGITARITAASLAFIINAMISAPTSMPGARRAIRRHIITTCCSCCTSLVSRVTREPVLKLSIFLKENAWTLANRSCRRSLVKLIDALDEK